MRLQSSIRAISAYRTSGGAERIAALRHEAEAHPEGVAPWMFAVVLWEEEHIAEAYSLGLSNLEKNPGDFTMLVICLDFHIRNKDQPQIDAFARRLAVAKSPVGFRRIADTVVSVLLGGRSNAQERTDAFHEWQRWAREHVKNHALPPSET